LVERHRGEWGASTRAVHAPEPAPQSGVPIVPVLDLSTTYAFDDIDAFAEASQAKTGRGYVYTRWANPTIDALEAAVADLEGADDAEAFASGMAAITVTMLSLCRSGDRIVAARQLYGGAYHLLRAQLPTYGIETSWHDVGDLDGIEKALDGARLLYCETIGNPRIEVADLDALAELAHAAEVPLVVDNTFASPALSRPIERGASLVIHSATKFLGGHHDLMGGIVCGHGAVVEEVKSVAREMGATLSPFNAWLALRGLATLPLRVERSSTTALVIAQALEERDDIDAVSYPALRSSADRELAERILGGRGGGVIGFDVAGGRRRARSFQERLRLVAPAASLGGTHSLIVHAASVTHTQLGPKELVAAGISEGFCRLSVGLEDPEDLMTDLLEALDGGR
jgi:cystathionine beta-lyase/cystathionine gamma-synthase